MRYLPLVMLAACSSPEQAPARTTVPATQPAAASQPVGERWAATLVVGAAFHDFVVVFTDPNAVLEAGSQHLPLSDVTHSADRLAFTLEKPNAPQSTWEHYDLARHGDTADGKGVIGAQTFQIRMERLGADEPAHPAFHRPQTPKPPFPYQQRELVVDAPDGGKLAGTLTIPTGAGPFPAVLLLSGSGQQDRDETIFGHKPYLIVADHLTRNGFVTFRFDDRGTGKTVGAPLSLDTEIADAGAIVDVLKKQPEIDPRRVGIIGHSAAGSVAPNVALAHRVAFVVLLAGTTLSGRDYAAFQTERAARAAGATDKDIVAQQAMQARVSAAALESKAATEAVLDELVAPQLEQALGRKPTADEVKQAVAGSLAAATDPWTVSYFRIDPRVAWKQLAIPVLLLVGDKDTQVPADMTIAALTSAVKPELATTRKLPGLNHLFQHAKTGEIDEYLTNEETFDPAALDVLTSWLVDHAKAR